MARRGYQLSLLNYCGGYDFDASYARYVLSSNKDTTVNVLIDSRGGQLATALSISAAFANHGDVHVHYTGINASAATIASLGAKRVTIAPDAFYLVHQASLPFYEFRSLNSDQITEFMANLEKAKADLLTYDKSISEAYARRCKKSPEELLALMKEERLLSAKEALDWGFVDEIESYEGDAPVRVSEELVAECSAIGIKLPQSLTPKGPLARFFSRLSDIFTTDHTQPESEPEMNTQNPAQPATQPATQTPAQPQATVEDRLASIEARLNNQPASQPAAQTPAQPQASAQPQATAQTPAQPQATVEDRLAAIEARLNSQAPAQPAAQPQATAQPQSPINPDGAPTQVVSGSGSKQPDSFAKVCSASAELYKALP